MLGKIKQEHYSEQACDTVRREGGGGFARLEIRGSVTREGKMGGVIG
jgi:hypothetical protein